MKINASIVYGLSAIAIVGILVYLNKKKTTYVQGDVNGDGNVDMGDIITVQRIIASLPDANGNPYSAEVVLRADVNGDGVVDQSDIDKIQQIMLEL